VNWKTGEFGRSLTRIRNKIVTRILATFHAGLQKQQGVGQKVDD